MDPRLENIVDAFQTAEARLDGLVAATSVETWRARPTPGAWSAAECVAHLTLTAEAFLPLLRDGLERTREMSGSAPRRLRRDPIGWLVWRGSREGGRMRTKTAAAFVPSAGLDRETLLATFAHLQAAQITAVRQADGLPVHRVRIASPFDRRVRYSLYSALTILPAHQHRHLAQAERAAGVSG